MRFSAVVCVIFLLSVPSATRADSHPHAREGFTFGLSLGGGSGSWNFKGLETDTVGGGAFGLRAGYALNSHVVIAGNLDNWMRREEVLGVDVTLRTWTLTAAATVFPGSPESALGGFFLRGGVGFGGTAAEFAVGGQKENVEEGGVAGVFGLGYEFRMTQSFALGISANGNVVGFDSEVIDTAQFGSFILQGTWYLN